jgi:hypothetical protein
MTAWKIWLTAPSTQDNSKQLSELPGISVKTHLSEGPQDAPIAKRKRNPDGAGNSTDLLENIA